MEQGRYEGIKCLPRSFHDAKMVEINILYAVLINRLSSLVPMRQSPVKSEKEKAAKLVGGEACMYELVLTSICSHHGLVAIPLVKKLEGRCSVGVQFTYHTNKNIL